MEMRTQQLVVDRDKERFVADLVRAPEGGPNQPVWLQELRTEAWERFQVLPFPTTKDEDWRFTSVAPILRAPLRPAREAAPRALTGGARAHALLGDEGWSRLVFLDEEPIAELTAVGAPLDAVRVADLAEAAWSYPDVVRANLGQMVPPDLNAFAALNTAVVRHGAFVHVTDRTAVDTPVHLVYVSSGTDGSDRLPATFPRTLVVAGRDSQVVIVESYLSRNEGPAFSDAVTELVLEDGAQVEHIRLLLESDSAYHIGTTRVRLGRASRYASFVLCTGDALSRSQLDVILGGEGASCTLDGLYVPRGAQHVDNHTMIEHREPHGTSCQLYKGVVADRSHAVFNGKIIVRPGAQRTDAQQTNRNLLISNEAMVDTKPQLEIFADDVRCTHGATVGFLDEDAYFYLRSRGIPSGRARALLTYGFVSDVLDRVRIEPLRARLARLLLQRLEPEAGLDLIVESEPGAGDR